MDNMMNFSFMTRYCDTMLKTYQAQSNRTSAATGVSFCDQLVEKSEEGKETERIVDTKAMSMEEYKRYIFDKISAFPIHPSNVADSMVVYIHDEGFEAMKNDPMYERWVLDCLRINFRTPEQWGGQYGKEMVVFHFGATKEECYIESWRYSSPGGNGGKFYYEKTEESFWDRRKKKREELLELLDELEEKKALAKRMARSEYFMELASIEPMFREQKELLNCDSIAMQIFSSFKANILLQSFQSKKG